MADRLPRLEKAYRENPDVPLFARLADLYLRRGRVLNALSLCEKGCERFPWYPTGYLVLSQCYEARGALEAARRAMGKALLLDPENPVGFKRLSRIYQSLGKPDLALKSLKRAVRLDPLDPELGERLDQLNYLLRRGSVVEAPEAFDVLPQEVVETTSEEVNLLESTAAMPAVAPVEPDLVDQGKGQVEEASEEVPLSAAAVAEVAGQAEALLIAETEKAPEDSTEEAAPDKPAAPATAQVTKAVVAVEVSVATEALEIASLADEAFGGSAAAAREREESESAVAESQEEPSIPFVEPASSAEPSEPAPVPDIVDEVEATKEPPEEAFETAEVAEVAELGEVALQSSVPATISDLADTLQAVEVPEPVTGADVPFAPRRSDSTEPAMGGVAPRDEEELVRLLHEIEEQEPPPAVPIEVPPEPEPEAPAEEPTDERPAGITIATATLAEIYLSQGLAQRAIQTYRQILAHDPGNEAARKRLADLEHGGRNRS